MLSFCVIISGAGLASLGPRDRPSYFVAVLAFESTALLVLEPSEVVPWHLAAARVKEIN